MEPSSLLRSMDVDLGAGLGDDLGGFEGFDDLFAHQSTTSDFFKFCALDEAEQDATVAAVPAPLSPGSSGASLGPFVSMGFGFSQQESCRLAQQSQTQNWENTLPLLTTDPTTTTLAHVRGKPRGRKRLEEDEALEAEEVACPSIKVLCATAVAARCCLEPLAFAFHCTLKIHVFFVVCSFIHALGKFWGFPSTSLAPRCVVFLALPTSYV